MKTPGNSTSWQRPRVKAFIAFLILVTLVIPISSARAADTQRYVGEIGGIPCEFGIIWYDDGSVAGLLDFQGRRIALRGENPKQGLLFFFDSDGDVYKLRKTLTKELVVWPGKMNDEVVVYLARAR